MAVDVKLSRIDEQFPLWVYEFGFRRAKILYWKNLITEMWPIVKEKGVNLLKALGLYEIFRQILG